MVLEDLAILFGDLAAWEALVSSCSFQGADATESLPARFLQRNLYGGGGYPGGRDVCHGG